MSWHSRAGGSSSWSPVTPVCLALFVSAGAWRASLPDPPRGHSRPPLAPAGPPLIPAGSPLILVGPRLTVPRHAIPACNYCSDRNYACVDTKSVVATSNGCLACFGVVFLFNSRSFIGQVYVLGHLLVCFSYYMEFNF